jgi:signal transduction histidine kinase
LLVLTIFFVMVSEILIYAPSVGRYRHVYLEERIAAAHLASLALEVPPDNMVSEGLGKELLDHAGSYGIVLRRPGSKSLMLAGGRPPDIAQTYDLREETFFGAIGEAFATMARKHKRYIQIIGVSPKAPDTIVQTVIDESELSKAMLEFSTRILQLSIAISLITAGLVYVALQWFFVRPMRAITASMVAFREDPEDARRLIVPSRRTDEIGVAERELAEMQTGLRSALQQRARLAALGTAVAKINHDLRNILATAQLVSDHLGSSDDPKVKRVAPTLLGAIDRAIRLCSQTLSFAHEGAPPPKLAPFALRELVGEIKSGLIDIPGRDVRCDDAGVPEDFRLDADREQIFRVLNNLLRNAYEAGARAVTLRAWADADRQWVEVADDGPGLPAKVRERLFQPFSGAGRKGGTGLGLAIARDLLRGHGGDIMLAATGEKGTRFRLFLPTAPAAPAVPATAGAAPPPEAAAEPADAPPPARPKRQARVAPG